MAFTIETLQPGLSGRQFVSMGRTLVYQRLDIAKFAISAVHVCFPVGGK